MQTEMELAVTDDITAGVRVVCSYTPGCKPTRDDPGEPPDIEVCSVEFDWLHINVGFDLEVLRESRNEHDRKTIDAWIWRRCDDEIREHCRKHYCDHTAAHRDD